jgi:hypothetical protein
MLLCSQSTAVTRASITSRNPTDTWRPKRHAHSWVGLPIFVFRLDDFERGSARQALTMKEWVLLKLAIDGDVEVG